MPPATREAQRAELHKAFWRVANDVSGSVDGWDFKSYVLGMFFYRFISENFTAHLNGMERGAGMEHFDFARRTDRELTQLITDENLGADATRESID